MKAFHLEQQWKQTQLIRDRSGEGATSARNQPLQHCIRWRDKVVSDSAFRIHPNSSVHMTDL